MKSVRIYHSIVNVMFESTVQIVQIQFITIPTKIPLINYQRSSFQKKIDFDVIRNALRNTQMYFFSNSIFLTLVKSVTLIPKS